MFEASFVNEGSPVVSDMAVLSLRVIVVLCIFWVRPICISNRSHNPDFFHLVVDPLKESGQNLYRQYAGKKNKIILNAHWIYSCIRDKTLHGFASNWANCKVTGQER